MPRQRGRRKVRRGGFQLGKTSADPPVNLVRQSSQQVIDDNSCSSGLNVMSVSPVTGSINSTLCNSVNISSFPSQFSYSSLYNCGSVQSSNLGNSKPSVSMAQFQNRFSVLPVNTGYILQIKPCDVEESNANTSPTTSCRHTLISDYTHLNLNNSIIISNNNHLVAGPTNNLIYNTVNLLPKDSNIIQSVDPHSNNTNLVDSNSSNTSVVDSNSSNTNVVDSNSSNTNVVDSNSSNTIVVDSNSSNTIVIDSNSSNTIVIDSNSSNTNVVDSNSSDTNVVDSNSSDTNVVDSNSSNTNLVDSNSNNSNFVDNMSNEPNLKCDSLNNIILEGGSANNSNLNAGLAPNSNNENSSINLQSLRNINNCSNSNVNFTKISSKLHATMSKYMITNISSCLTAIRVPVMVNPTVATSTPSSDCSLDHTTNSSQVEVEDNRLADPSKNVGMDCQSDATVVSISSDSDDDKPLIERCVSRSNMKSQYLSSSSNDECPICLQSCVHPSRLPCTHIFCYLCLKGIAIAGQNCPMCRAPIPHHYRDHPVLLSPSVEQTQFTTDVIKNKEREKYSWFYQARNGGWWEFEERMSDEIEENHSVGRHVFDMMICGQLYTIDTLNNIQYPKNSPFRTRKILRELPSRVKKKGVAGIHGSNLPSTSKQ